MALFRKASELIVRLRSTYWFVPAAVTVLSMGLAIGLVYLDRSLGTDAWWLSWVYGGGADGARALLSAVAGSVITVVSVTFSVLVVALTVSSQHFGPRLLNNFMHDNAAQAVLGTFTGTFAYCLIVLRTVTGELDDGPAFVPHVAITAGVLLTLVSVGMLIFYVHHVAVALQVSQITANVASELEGAIGRLYPDPFGGSIDLAEPDPPPVPDDAVHITANASGYVQHLDAAAVLAIAGRHDTVIWIIARPGAFVTPGSAVAAVHPPPRDLQALQRSFRRALTLGADRTARQDAAFAIQQLVEIALRALSPGVNEPFTAVTCVDRLRQGLTLLMSRRVPSAVRLDDAGRRRVVAPPLSVSELLELAFDPIARHTGQEITVALRLLEALDQLRLAAQRPDQRAAVAAATDMTFRTLTRHIEDETQLPRLSAIYERARHA
jgi:uncharacterized membrane protein